MIPPPEHPDGPVATARPGRIIPPRPQWSVRLLGLGLLTASAAVLGVAIWLKPDSRGYGTHEQMGAGACGVLLVTRYPCPSCGMTTSFAHTVRGQWPSAIWAQPAGFLLALTTIIVAGGSFWMLATGRMPPLNYLAITPYRTFATLLVVLLGGWGIKVLIGLIEGSLPLRR